MSDYDAVIDALDEHDLSWGDVDRIHLNPPEYQEFHDRASFNPANHATTDKPSVRVTTKEPKLIYVDEYGYEVEIGL